LPYVQKTHRYGLLVPSSNSTQEPEFAQALPDFVSLHVGRLPWARIDADTVLRSVEELEFECCKLADADVDVIVLGIAAASVAKGKGYDEQLIQRMEDASGKPATTAATAFRHALSALGVRRVAIAAPWSKAINVTMVDFLVAHGIEVVHSELMGYVQNTELGRVDPETAYEFGRRADRAQAQAVIIPGGNWPTMSIAGRLEQDLGKPVLTNNCVCIWDGLKKIGCHTSIPGYGRLLERYLTA
jgi:maleate cis-trans isomerase